MLLPILLAAALLPAQEVSAHCVDTGAEIASNQTERLRGPSGMAAVLRVSTADDHSKNSHECNAEYQLLISHPGVGTPVLVDLLTSDAEYESLKTPCDAHRLAHLEAFKRRQTIDFG